MDFHGKWTPFALDAEYDDFGMVRIAKMHNKMHEELERKCRNLERENDLLREEIKRLYVVLEQTCEAMEEANKTMQGFANTVSKTKLR